jgi:putative hemolysin
MIDLSDDPEDIRKTIVDSEHSRLPMHQGVSDDVLGVVQAKDLPNAYLAGTTPDVLVYIPPAPMVLETISALDTVDVIKGSPVHMVLVHDEFGQVRTYHTAAGFVLVAWAICLGSERRSKAKAGVSKS